MSRGGSSKNFSPMPAVADLHDSAKLPVTSRVGAGIAEPRRLGQYEIVRLLGRGGMGVVYEATHSHLRRRVALKMISANRLGDAKAVKRFYREMAAIGTLEHPNIVRAHDAGEIDGTLYLAMELVDGSNVETIAESLGPLGVAESCEVVRQAALALAYSHRNGVVHRDIKPSNLLLNSDGVVKVSDLGLARLYGQTAQGDITGKDCIVGTPDYMSPEQAQGDPSLDERTDLYSLGCTLYRLLAGMVPFDGPKYLSGIQKILGHVNDDPSPIDEIREGLPAEISTIIGRMMAKSPDERFHSAEELVQALERPAANADLAALVRRARKCPSSLDSPSIFHSTATDLRHTGGHANPLPLTQPIRRRWRVMAGLAIGCLFLMGIYFSRTWWSSAGDDPSPSSTGVSTGSTPSGSATASDRERATTVPQKPKTFQIGSSGRLVWHELLKSEPIPLNWPQDSGLSSWSQDAELSQLSVNCRHTGLLALGSVDAESWTLQIDVFQTSWTGGAGLFWGYRSVASENGPRVTYQRIGLQRIASFRRTPTFSICLERVTAKSDDHSNSDVSGVDLAIEHVRPPDSKPQMLEVTVRRGQLVRVRWAGQSLENLCSETANRQFTAEDQQGKFGTYNCTSNAVFRNARIMLH